MVAHHVVKKTRQVRTARTSDGTPERRQTKRQDQRKTPPGSNGVKSSNRVVHERKSISFGTEMHIPQ